jgi:O-antigen/teichoic acid export membrane protein
VRRTVGHLGKGVAIYGAGDAAINVVNLLLLPVYVKLGYLARDDYGALGLIIAIEMIARILSRWGLDGAFMRFYGERAAGRPLETLTSTIVWFVLAADVVLFGVLFALSGWIGRSLFPAELTAFRLMLLNTFLLGLTFVPFHVMRLRNQATAYSGLVFARSAGTVAVRLVLVIGLGWGLTGWFAADVIVTLALLPILSRWMRPLTTAVFSTDELRAVLRFGLPRLPHGLAQQALDAGNKLLLTRYISLEQQGVYNNGVTLGTGIRFFTSAFETAWAPFYYSTSRQPDAVTVFSKVTTYGFAMLTLLVAGTVAASRDAILTLLSPDYLDAVYVVPFIALGIAAQGVYLLTSIGLNLTSRTQYYPVATFAALAVGLAGGLILMPRLGIMGAAIAFASSGVTQALVAFVFSRRFYKIPYEVGRLTRILVAGALACAGAIWVVPDWPPLAALLVRLGVTAILFGGLLAVSGFFRASERAFVREMARRFRRREAPVKAIDAE